MAHWQGTAGQFSRWGPLTGIARERETRDDDVSALRAYVPHPRILRLTAPALVGRLLFPFLLRC